MTDSAETSGALVSPRAARWLGGVAFVALLLYVWASGYFAEIKGKCTLGVAPDSKHAKGSCSFQNTGWGGGYACASVGLTNKRKLSDSSEKICSGFLWPSGETTRKVLFELPKDHCRGAPGQPWKDICEVNLVFLQ